MKKCYALRNTYVVIKITEWYGYLLMQLVMWGYRRQMLTLKQAVSGLSYSNQQTRRALKQLRVIREQRKTDRLRHKEKTK